MRHEHTRRERRYRREHFKGNEAMQHRGPKTFRRGRAVSFLESLKLKRSAIMKQLDQPEFASIQSILVGELKAIDMVINEFIQLFEIHESEVEEGDLGGGEKTSL